MALFDTHAHLNDARFDADRHEITASLPERGVGLVLDVACDVRETAVTMELIARYEHVYAAVGMHPHEAAETTLAHLDEVERLMQLPKVVALGEIGLDYHYDLAPREVQRKWFALQLELAQSLDVPVVLHVREAFGDAFDILRAHRQGLKGVMHCFSGSAESALECVRLGLYVAFGGAITFANANKLLDAAAAVPSDRLLVETDCPYLSPVPYRGKRNEPALIEHTARRLAALRGVSFEELASTTAQNGMRLFGINA